MPQFDAWFNTKTTHAGAPAGTDKVLLVDESDTTEDPGGTLKRVAVSDLVPSGTSTLASVDQAGTAYTLAATDAGKVVRMTAAGAATVTVPTNATVAFAVGTVINVYAAGAGGVTVAAATDVTIRNNGAALAQYDEVSLRKDAADEWVRVG